TRGTQARRARGTSARSSVRTGAPGRSGCRSSSRASRSCSASRCIARCASGCRRRRRCRPIVEAMRPPPRSRAQRKEDTLARLRDDVDCWVASADEAGNAHLVPLSYYWDGTALVLATPRSSPTATNLLRAGVARLGVGPTRDVVIVDGSVEEGADDATAAAH